MKKSLLTIASFILLFVNSYSQSLESIYVDNDEVANAKLLFTNDWVAEIENDFVYVYNGRIENKSNTEYKNLTLSLYLMPEKSLQTTDVIQVYFINSVSLNSFPNSSSLGGINLKKHISNSLPSIAYKPILVIRDKRGTLLSYKILDKYLFEAKDGGLIASSSVETTEITPVEVADLPNDVKSDVIKENTYTRIPESKLVETNITKPEELSEKVTPKTKQDLYPIYDFTEQLSDSIKMEKDWKVEINFPTTMVSIKGGDILNTTQRDLQNVTLKVYISKSELEENTTSFEGLVIAEADLKELKSSSKMTGLNIMTDLLSIPQGGTYYMFLTLSEKNENEKDIIRAKKMFTKSITL